MRTTSRLMVALLVAVAAPLVTPMTSANAAGDVSSWAMDGTKGDWVSGGNSYYYDALDGATITAEGTEQAIQLHVTKGSHYFYANVAAPVGETLDAGDVFRNATRFGGETPRLEVYGDGRGCNEMLGDFVIHDLDFDGGTGDVLQMSVTFEQHCETGQSALLGSIAFNADAAEPIPSLGEIAFSGGALDAGLGAPSGLSVNVDATGSGDNSTIKTHWDASNDSDVIGYTAVIVPSTEPASEPWGNEQFFRGTTRSASTKVNSRAIRTVSVFGYDADGNWSEPVAKTIRPSKLSIGLSDGSAKYGQRVKVQGQLKLSTGQAVKDEPVMLFSKASGDWRKVDQTHTSLNGSYNFGFAAKRNSQLQVRYDGGLETYGSTSDNRGLKVAKVVNAKVKDATVNVGQVVRFSGRVAPYQKTLVKMELYYRGSWRTVTQGYSGNDGRFVAAVVLNRSREYKFRFFSPKTSDTGAGVSRVITVTAR